MAMTMPAASTPGVGDAASLVRYGFWALPLAFAALPLYVHLPAHMAAQPGWTLAAVGGLLLAVRAADALVDPWLGRGIDRVAAGRGVRLLALGLAGALLLGAGWSALFLATWPAGAEGWVLLGLVLLVTSLGTSLAQIAHQAWGVALAGGDARPDDRPAQGPEGGQARWVGAREAGTLVGVIVASVLPALAGWPLAVAAWWLLALLGALALAGLVRRPGTPSPQGEASTMAASAGSGAGWPLGWTRPLLVQLANGVAAAVPATLVLLVVRDVLEGDAAWQAGALLLYFGSAALAVPLAVRLVARLGARRAWAWGMAAAALAFLPFALSPTRPVFLLVCAFTGAALALETLAGQTLWIARLDAAGPAQRARGFGWWALVNKATLALAAGLALPLVQMLGYRAGQDDAPAQGLGGLLFVYVGLPVVFKLLALALLLAVPPGGRAQALGGSAREIPS